MADQITDTGRQIRLWIKAHWNKLVVSTAETRINPVFIDIKAGSRLPAGHNEGVYFAIYKSYFANIG